MCEAGDRHEGRRSERLKAERRDRGGGGMTDMSAERLFIGRIGSEKNALLIINIAAAAFFAPAVLMLLAYLAVAFRKSDIAAMLDGLLPVLFWTAVPAWLAKAKSPLAALILALAAGLLTLVTAVGTLVGLIKGNITALEVGFPTFLLTSAMLALALRARLAARLLRAAAARAAAQEAAVTLF
jgi:hypothetical protein